MKQKHRKVQCIKENFDYSEIRKALLTNFTYVKEYKNLTRLLITNASIITYNLKN